MRTFGAFSMMLRLSSSRCLGSWDTLRGDSSRSDNLRPRLPGRLPCILSSRLRRTSGRLALLRSRHILREPFRIRFAAGVFARRALPLCKSGRRLWFWDFGFALSRHRFHTTAPNHRRKQTRGTPWGLPRMFGICSWFSVRAAYADVRALAFSVIPRLHQRRFERDAFLDPVSVPLSQVIEFVIFVPFEFAASCCYCACSLEFGLCVPCLLPRMTCPNHALHRNSRCAFHVRCLLVHSLSPLRSTTSAPGCG